MGRSKQATVTIITAGEISSVYDVQPETVKKWRVRYSDFPKPVGFGIRGPRRDSPNWEWDAIRDWVELNRPLLLIGREIQFPIVER